MIYCEETTTVYYSLQNLSGKSLNALQRKLNGKQLSVTDKIEIERIQFALENPHPLKSKA